MNIVADVYVIVNNIDSHLIVLKLANVTALALYYMWQMLLPCWLMELPLKCFECWQMLLLDLSFMWQVLLPQCLMELPLRVR